MIRPRIFGSRRFARDFGSAVCILGSLVSPALAATIHSTAAGGPWTAPSTWVGGAPPAPADDVVLAGPVTVTGTTSCASLESAAAGRLANAAPGFATLHVAGAVANAGTIEDGGGPLRLRVGGDLDNEGAWTVQETILVGTTARHLTQSQAAVFESKLLQDPAAVGDLFIDTPFAILGDVDLNSVRIVLGPNCPLTLRQGFLAAEALCNGNEIRFEASSYLNGTQLDAAVLSGPGTMTGGVFTGGLTVLTSLSNVQSFGNAHAQILGGLVNHGVIHNAHYGFTIDLGGDLECHGTILNSFVSLDGEATHHLRMGPNADLGASVFLPEFGAGTIVVETDAQISDGIALGPGGTMILEPGVTLHLTGGSLSGGTLTTNGNGIVMESSGYLWIEEVDALVLHGTARVADEMHVAADVHVVGALENWPFLGAAITLEGDFVNDGHVRDNTQTLTLRVRGDVRNTGLLENQRVVLDGALDQRVEFGEGIGTPEFVVESGFLAASYQWTRDGVAIPGATGAQLQLAGVDAADAGIYRCEGGGGQVSRDIVMEQGQSTDAPVIAAGESAAWRLSIASIRPNPVRLAGGGAAIDFALPTPAIATLRIVDVSGREVARLANGALAAGAHRATWAARGAAPGVYFVRLEAAGASTSRKITLVK